MGFFSGLLFSSNPSVKLEEDEKVYIETNADTPSKNQQLDSSVTIDEQGNIVRSKSGSTFTQLISSDDNNNSVVNSFSSTSEDNRQKNPYVKLLEDFHDSKDGKTSRAKSIKTSDFMYLRDIGVFPINKMFILKRFDGQTPSYDLNDHDSKGLTMGTSTSTVIGWVKDEKELFSFNFNEVWKTQSKWLHELLREIMQNQFGLDIGSIFPIPGWGQGLLFEMMHEMGMSSYDKNHLPFGDPNLLREGVLRETTSTGLASSMSFKLETVYEIKYINGVDPSIIFHNIIKNLLTMGTSDMNFMLTNSSSIRNLENLFANPSVGGVYNLVKGFIDKVINAVTSKLTSIKKDYASEVAAQTAIDKTQADKNIQSDKKQKYYELVGKLEPDQVPNKDGKVLTSKQVMVELDSDGNSCTKRAVTYSEWVKAKNIIDAQKTQKDNASSIQPLLEKGKTKAKNAIDLVAKVVESGKFIEMIKSQIDGILKATLSRYLQEIKGAINQATGANNTPWHLTIGNPYSPIISMNNIKVSNVDIKLGSELLFNDLPKFIYVTISVEQARNLGKQEMLRMFGVKYKRNYSKAYRTDNVNGDTTGSNIPKHVIDTQTKNASAKSNPHKPIKKIPKK